jgi:hypothetical protein
MAWSRAQAFKIVRTILDRINIRLHQNAAARRIAGAALGVQLDVFQAEHNELPLLLDVLLVKRLHLCFAQALACLWVLGPLAHLDDEMPQSLQTPAHVSVQQPLEQTSCSYCD